MNRNRHPTFIQPSIYNSKSEQIVQKSEEQIKHTIRTQTESLYGLFFMEGYHFTECHLKQKKRKIPFTEKAAMVGERGRSLTISLSGYQM